MLVLQQQLQFSEFDSLYEKIIPKTNLLRKINDLVDFSFIHDELLNTYCLTNGRNAESPVRMFKYFLGMSTEEDVINPRSLSKFRKLRLKDTDLLNLLINKTVTLAIEKGVIRSKSIIVDATHSGSRSNPYSAIDVLRERSKLLRKAVYQFEEGFKDQMPKKNIENNLEKELNYCLELEKIITQNESISSIPAVKEKLNFLKETVEDTKENIIFSKDKEAKIGHKSADSSFFGYKTHLAMTEERIITAAVITSGEKGDGPELPNLLKISQENGIGVDTIIGDGAYSGKENLKLAESQDIKIVAKVNPSITQGSRKEDDKFDFNKDTDRFVCPAGHLAIRKARQGKKNRGKNQADTYYFDVEKCKVCPLQKGCYKQGA